MIGGKEAAPPESKPESKLNRKMKVAKSLETPPAVTATGQLAAQRLTTFEAEVSRLAVDVSAALVGVGASTVEYHTADPKAVPQIRPYLAVMQQACRLAGLEFEMVVLAGDPD